MQLLQQNTDVIVSGTSHGSGTDADLPCIPFPATASSISAQFGSLLSTSHCSSRDDFKNSCPELDLVLEIASSIPGFAGGRLQGGGFGGSTIHLVDTSVTDIEEFQRALLEKYKIATGMETSAFAVFPGEGATCGTL